MRSCFVENSSEVNWYPIHLLEFPQRFGGAHGSSFLFRVIFRCTPDRCFFIMVCLYDFPMLRLFFLHFRCLFSKNSSKHPHLRFFLGACRTSFFPISSHGRTLADFCRSWAASVSVFSMRSPPAHI